MAITFFFLHGFVAINFLFKIFSLKASSTRSLISSFVVNLKHLKSYWEQHRIHQHTLLQKQYGGYDRMEMEKSTFVYFFLQESIFHFLWSMQIVLMNPNWMSPNTDFSDSLGKRHLTKFSPQFVPFLPFLKHWGVCKKR